MALAISPMVHSQTLETWIVEKDKWEAALEQGGVNPAYAEQTLSKLKLVTLQFQKPQNPTPILRIVEETQPIKAHLLKDDGKISVYYAANPRVQNHLWVSLNRDVDHFTEVTADEALLLQKTVNKLLGILRETFEIPYSVIAQWNTNRPNHLAHRFTIEIIPSRPETPNEHNVWDKIECNNYVISDNLYTNSLPTPTLADVQRGAALWEQILAKSEEPVFSKQLAPEPFKDWTQIQTNRDKAAEEILAWLHESLAQKGVGIERRLNESVEIQGTLVLDKKGCAFCLKKVIDSQKVYETKFSYVLYNFKPAKPGGHFLLLPKRHVAGVENLREEEVRDLHELSVALTKILESRFKGSIINQYTQDGPWVGQTVPHGHKHIVVTPDSLRYLFFSINYEDEKPLTQEEMRPVLEEIGKHLSACDL